MLRREGWGSGLFKPLRPELTAFEFIGFKFVRHCR